MIVRGAGFLAGYVSTEFFGGKYLLTPFLFYVDTYF